MAKYEVIRYFEDLQDSNHAYNVGDSFPRNGVSVGQSRLEELAGSSNKQGRPLIKLVDEPEEADDFAQHMNPPEGEAPKYDYSKNDIMRMPKAKLVSLAEELGIEDAADKSGNTLKPLIIKRLGL